MTTLVGRIRAFLDDYAKFEDDRLSVVLALWVIGTHLVTCFDAFPYLVITSMTKRSGKTRLSELLGFLAQNAKNFSAMTPPTLFRIIDPAKIGEVPPDWRKPTVIFDEAEVLSGESASIMRAVLNVGYRRGQTIPRVAGTKVIEFDTYCPKIFILIGDVYDTLNDRSIVASMKRGEPKRRFDYETASGEGKNIKAEIEALTAGDKGAFADRVRSHYATVKNDFLADREEEIWRPLFAVAEALDFDKHEKAGLCRIAADLSGEKTRTKRKYMNMEEVETDTENDAYAKRLLMDLAGCFAPGETAVASTDALKRLHDLDTGPWRKFRGAGLTFADIGNLLSRFGVRPQNIRLGRGRKNSVVTKGYTREKVEKARGAL